MWCKLLPALWWKLLCSCARLEWGGVEGVEGKKKKKKAKAVASQPSFIHGDRLRGQNVTTRRCILKCKTTASVFKAAAAVFPAATGRLVSMCQGCERQVGATVGGDGWEWWRRRGGGGVESKGKFLFNYPSGVLIDCLAG